MSPPYGGAPYVVTGRVIKAYGVLGWVKIEVLSSNPRRFTPGNAFFLEGSEREGRLILEEVSEAPGALLVRFRGFTDRAQALQLAGCRLLVTAEEVGEPPPGSLWEHQVIGLEVRTCGGERLGVVEEVMETGANDVLIVQGDKEYLIPMTAEVVREIDPHGGAITIEPLPGLLEE